MLAKLSTLNFPLSTCKIICYICDQHNTFMPAPIIHVQNLAKKFKLKQKPAGFKNSFKALFKPQYKDITAVDNINFTVNKGEILAFIGPNGAGKSTTIKMLSGILYPSGGSIEVLGFDPTKKRRELAYHIGLVFGQKPQLWYHLPPQDTYELLSHIYELDRDQYAKRKQFLVEAFSIQDLLNTPVRKLSLGQRMRCELVASLIHQPQIIFLDEPTIGLDVIAKQQIRDVIKYLNEKEHVTIFLTSHDAGDIEMLAQRTIVINHGTIIFDDTTQALKKNYIKKKLVEIVFSEAKTDFNCPYGELVKQTSSSITIAVDVAETSIEKVMQYVFQLGQVQDINIYDPPMEEIIAAIYTNKQSN
jgi:ABC-2 type transport system ATP-binding protein